MSSALGRLIGLGAASLVVAAGGLVSLAPAALAVGAGANLYVAPSGSNTSDCQTPSAPCSSVSYVQSLLAGLGGGNTVHFAAGQYLPDTNFLTVPNTTYVGPQQGVPAE